MKKRKYKIGEMVRVSNSPFDEEINRIVTIKEFLPHKDVYDYKTTWEEGYDNVFREDELSHLSKLERTLK